MFSLMMALFLAALDVTIIATALPTIATEFNASNSNYLWVGSSYLLANAASVPLWGKLSDIWVYLIPPDPSSVLTSISREGSP